MAGPGALRNGQPVLLPGLKNHGLSLDTVLSRLRAENRERTAGRVTSGRREIIVRTTGELASLEEIRSVLIARSGPNKVYLRDIARVEDAHEVERVITRFNGEDCVKISVLKEAEANTVEVADAVAARLADLHASFPDAVRIATSGPVDGRLFPLCRSWIINLSLSLSILPLPPHRPTGSPLHQETRRRPLKTIQIVIPWSFSSPGYRTSVPASS